MRSVLWSVCVYWQWSGGEAARLRARSSIALQYGPRALTEGLEPDFGGHVLEEEEEEELEEQAEAAPQPIHFVHPLHEHALPPCPMCGHHCGGTCGGGGGNNLNLALVPHNGGMPGAEGEAPAPPAVEEEAIVTLDEENEEKDNVDADAIVEDEKVQEEEEEAQKNELEERALEDQPEERLRSDELNEEIVEEAEPFQEVEKEVELEIQDEQEENEADKMDSLEESIADEDAIEKKADPVPRVTEEAESVKRIDKQADELEETIMKHPIVEPEPLPERSEVFCDEVEEEKHNAQKLESEIKKKHNNAKIHAAEEKMQDEAADAESVINAEEEDLDEDEG